MKFSYDVKRLENELNPIYIDLIEKVQASSKADKHYSGKVDVTKLLEPFAHLKLDENYKLIAYSSYENHGTFGEVVAIEKDSEIPDVYLEREFCLFQKITPDNCRFVSEVVICNGTPEGIFEMELLNEVFFKLFKGYTEICFGDFVETEF